MVNGINGVGSLPTSSTNGRGGGMSRSPSVPSVSRSPSVPSVPRSPSVPSVPRSPSVPSVPRSPSVPSVPRSPSVPSVSRSASVSSVQAGSSHQVSQSPLSGNDGNRKRKDWMAIAMSSVAGPKKSRIGMTPVGPIYEEKEDSLILYQPIASKKFDVLKPDGLVPVVVHPELVKGKSMDGEDVELFPLKSPQINGLKFMWNAFFQKKGSILAHEMGLGKTRTVITLILTLLEQAEEKKGRSSPGIKKCVIIAPKNGVEVWKEELAKWSPSSMHVAPKTIHSYMKARECEDILQNFDQASDDKILILSYNSFKKYKNVFQDFTNTVELAVCDEAHLLKNKQAQRTLSLKSLKADVWVGVTGTPYQNSVTEYADLVTFFRPNILPKDYAVRICRPIVNYWNKHKTLDAEKHEMLLTLKNALQPVLHYESNNLNVDKHEVIICAPLDGDRTGDDRIQHGMYNSLTTPNANGNTMEPLCFYQKLDILTKVCIHPTHAYDSYPDREEFKPFESDLQEMSPAKMGAFSYNLSGKVALLINMLSNITNQSNDKVVIASYSKQLLDMIRDLIKTDYIKALLGPNITFKQYDGATSVPGRNDALKDFNAVDSVRILLLSCKAGGTAVTLTRANHLFLLDPDWNPFNDRQTIGRIYRVGQKLPVYIYRFVCTGTIEEIKFLNQLSKEEVDKFFKGRDESESEQNKKILFPFGGNDLIRYYPDTLSHIKDLLDGLKRTDSGGDIAGEEDTSSGDGSISEEDDENEEVRDFAEELAGCNHYSSFDQLPDELKNLKEVWTEKPKSVSFVFHLKKVKDEMETVLFGPVDPPPIVNNGA